MDIRRHHVLYPITAAEVVHVGSDKILLAGEGPFIKLFSLTSCCLLHVVQVLQTQAIHGISHFILPSSHSEKSILLALWGGRSLGLVRLRVRQDSDRVRVEDAIIEGKRQLDDWILDAKFVNNSQGFIAGLVLLDVQNNLFSLDFSGNTINERPCLLAQGPSSALYCGDIHLRSSDDILIAVGTVFGGVHLWSIRLVGNDATSSRISAVYTAHEGSVFGISLVQAEIHGSLRWIILTCSDDRTIKVWDITDELQKSHQDALFHDIDTGFARKKLENHFKSPIASGSAHISRIWRIMAMSSTKHPLMLVSFGEDGTVQFWYLQGKVGTESLSLTKGRSARLHSGRNIWAAAKIEDQTAGNSRIATGGADGRLVVSVVDSPCSQMTWSSRSPENKEMVTSETFVSCCWLNSMRLLAITAAGSILLGGVDHNNQRLAILWTQITKLTELSRSALIAAPGPDHALIMGPAGHVYLFTLKRMKVGLLKQVPCKPSFLAAIYSGGKDSIDRISIFATNKSTSKLQFGIVYLGRDPDDTTDSIFHEISLTPGFIITAACHLGSDTIALGSRAGDVAIYRIDNNATLQWLTTIHKVHQRETVTSITAIEGREWMLTTGRDGHYSIHKIQYSYHTVDYSLVHSGQLPFGPNIEGAGILNGKLQIWGFRAQESVLWDHSLQQELSSIDCGGRHSNWCFSHGAVSALAWTRAGEIHVASLQPNSIILQQGTHGREIKTLAIRSSQDTLGRVVATGAEDTCIHLSRYDNEKAYQTLEVIPTHMTGLQKLAWSSNGRFLFSAAGQEEFFIWEIQPVPILSIGVRLISRCPPISRTHILRIMDFNFIEGQPYTILMVYSDSSIRVWNFDFQTGTWELLRETTYTTCCITQCKMLGQYFLTASTDGSLVLWSAGNLAQIAKQHVHQSSIKCLEVAVQDDYILIATGGDDGMLAFCLLDTGVLSAADLSAPIAWHVLLIPRAHAAAVNALAFVPQSALSSKFELVSASNDQVVRTWTMTVTKEDRGLLGHWHIDITRHSKHASSVADASCVQAFTEDGKHSIIVAGIGLEFWKGGECNSVDEQLLMQ